MQLSLEDYSRLRSDAIRTTRIKVAKELCEQAEDLLRISDHLNFESALALLERLRKEEPANTGMSQQIAERTAQLANVPKV